MKRESNNKGLVCAFFSNLPQKYSKMFFKIPSKS